MKSGRFVFLLCLLCLWTAAAFPSWPLYGNVFSAARNAKKPKEDNWFIKSCKVSGPCSGNWECCNGCLKNSCAEEEDFFDWEYTAFRDPPSNKKKPTNNFPWTSDIEFLPKNGLSNKKKPENNFPWTSDIEFLPKNGLELEHDSSDSFP